MGGIHLPGKMFQNRPNLYWHAGRFLVNWKHDCAGLHILQGVYMPTMGEGIKVKDSYRQILTPESLAFLIKLQSTFNPVRLE